MAVRDESPEEPSTEAPTEETQPDNSAEIENQHRWRIYRQGRRSYVYAEPGTTKPGTYRMACVSHEAARNACLQLARDDRYGPRRANPDDPPEPPPPASTRANNRAGRAEEALAGLKPRRGTPTHYVCGHPRTPENTYGDTKGQITCRTCAKEKNLARYHARPKKHRASRSSQPKGEQP